MTQKQIHVGSKNLKTKQHLQYFLHLFSLHQGFCSFIHNKNLNQHTGHNKELIWHDVQMLFQTEHLSRQ